MGLGNLIDRNSGDTILADFFNSIHSALNGDFVGRNSSGIPTPNQNLGSAAIPWGAVRADSIIIGGSAVDTSQVIAPVSRVISGKTRTTSNQPAFITPNGAANSFILAALTTNLLVSIDAVAVTFNTNITVTGLTVAPGSNNTCLVDDTDAADQEATRTWGEYGAEKEYITVDTMGANITSKIGTYQAFSIFDGANTEYFLAFVESSTRLSRIYRGFFYNSSLNPINRIKFANNDTITIMSLGWIFVDEDTATVDVTYNNPTWSFTAPASPVTGDYWYDIPNDVWKRYDGASFQIVARTLVGMVIIDTANCVGARCIDFYFDPKTQNTLSLEVRSNTIIRSKYTDALVYVAGGFIEFHKSLPEWDITAELAGSADMYNASEQPSTYYWVYVKDDGDEVLSDISPYYRPDFGGVYYHPHNPWRAVGKAFNNSGSNFDAALDISSSSTSEYDEVVANPAIAGLSTQTTLSAAISAASTDGEVLAMQGALGSAVLNKRLSIKGKGYGSVVTNFQLSSGCDFSWIRGLRITGTLTIDAGVQGVQMTDCLMDDPTNVTDNSTPGANYLRLMEY